MAKTPLQFLKYRKILKTCTYRQNNASAVAKSRVSKQETSRDKSALLTTVIVRCYEFCLIEQIEQIVLVHYSVVNQNINKNVNQ